MGLALIYHSLLYRINNYFDSIKFFIIGLLYTSMHIIMCMYMIFCLVGEHNFASSGCREFRGRAVFSQPNLRT